MFVSRRARLGLITAGVLAAATVVPTATTAYAAPPPITLRVQNGAVSEAGKWFSPSLRSAESDPWRLDHTTLVVDIADVADLVTAWVPQYDENGDVQPADNCTTAGTVLTCDLGTRHSYGLNLPYLVVAAKPGAELGRSGRITLTVTADGIQPLVATSKVTVADDIDLAIQVAKMRVTALPGQPVQPAFEVTNTGSKPVTGAAMRLVGYAGLQQHGRFTNCGYDTSGQLAHCRFDAELAPGTTYVLSEPALEVRANAKPETEGSYSAFVLTGDDFDDGDLLSGLTMGTSGVLRLVAKPAANTRRVPVTDSNRANNFAVGRVSVLAATAPSPSLSPSASPSASPSGSASASPSASVSASGSGGGLPVTGVPTAAIAAGGAALLLLGVAGLAVARRRRQDFAA